MRVTWLENATGRFPRVALGQFDGVHAGHRRLIGERRTVLSFDPHPQAVLPPDRPPRLLVSLARKIKLLEGIGAEELVLIRFDRARAAQSPEEFIQDVLVERLGVDEVSVGENFRFGHRARGDASLLQADLRFGTRVVPLLHSAGEPVSSTRIRRLIAEGDISGAARILCSPVRLRGTVIAIPKAGRGATVRFADDSVLPPRARYRCASAAGHGVLRLVRCGPDPLAIEGILHGFDVRPGDEVELELASEPRAPGAYAARRRAVAPHM